MSPLWDGRWTTLDFAKYGTGIHTDIIKYENNLVKVYGNPYAVRIIYGPYDYVGSTNLRQVFDNQEINMKNICSVQIK